MICQCRSLLNNSTAPRIGNHVLGIYRSGELTSSRGGAKPSDLKPLAASGYPPPYTADALECRCERDQGLCFQGNKTKRSLWIT